MSRPRSERGAATLMVAHLAAFVVGLTVILVVIAAYVLAAHRARGAADLAALAAAHSYSQGGEACPTAAAVAQANQGRLTGCEVSGPPGAFAVSVTVAADVGLRLPVGPTFVEAVARAGTPAS